MTHFPCLFPALPIQQASRFFSLSLCIQAVEHFTQISADCSSPKGCTLMAAGFAASSPPNSRSEPELLAADRYQGAEQTMDLIQVPGNTPCQLQPQPNGPSLSLTVLYLKGHCRFASLPCSEQYIYIYIYICYRGSRRGREAGREAGKARHRWAAQRCPISSAVRG